MANVIFKTGTSAQYNALTERPVTTLYWLEDTKEIRKGDELYGVGRLATTELSGLMSPIDKKNLDWLMENSGKNVAIPEFTIEKQNTAEDGFSASYKLKRTYGEEVSYVGDTINIPKDLVLQGASLKTVTMNGVPYEGALVGDPYLDLVFNDADNSHIYVPVKGLVETSIAGNGIEITDCVVSVKIDGAKANGLVAVGNGLGLNLATRNSAGAMSAVDKLAIEGLPMMYEQVEYEIGNTPTGTLVDYREKEIRVMCPTNTVWKKQAVGSTGNANYYYMSFKAYAPKGAVGFKEGDQGVIEDEYFDFSGDFAGTDEFGRNYSIVWLALASYDEATDTWTYFGKNSSTEKYIGWTYIVNWYDANGIVIDSDSIRINLTNEDCHTDINPYYLGEYATDEELKDVQDEVLAMKQSFTWSEM